MKRNSARSSKKTGGACICYSMNVWLRTAKGQKVKGKVEKVKGKYEPCLPFCFSDYFIRAARGSKSVGFGFKYKTHAQDITHRFL